MISWKPTLLEVRPLIPEHLRVVGRRSGTSSLLRPAGSTNAPPSGFFHLCFWTHFIPTRYFGNNRQTTKPNIFFLHFVRQTKTQTTHFKPFPNLTCQFLKNRIFILVEFLTLSVNSRKKVKEKESHPKLPVWSENCIMNEQDLNKCEINSIVEPSFSQ